MLVIVEGISATNITAVTTILGKLPPQLVWIIFPIICIQVSFYYLLVCDPRGVQLINIISNILCKWVSLHHVWACVPLRVQLDWIIFHIVCTWVSFHHVWACVTWGSNWIELFSLFSHLSLPPLSLDSREGRMRRRLGGSAP